MVSDRKVRCPEAFTQRTDEDDKWRLCIYEVHHAGNHRNVYGEEWR